MVAIIKVSKPIHSEIVYGLEKEIRDIRNGSAYLNFIQVMVMKAVLFIAITVAAMVCFYRLIYEVTWNVTWVYVPIQIFIVLWISFDIHNELRRVSPTLDTLHSLEDVRKLMVGTKQRSERGEEVLSQCNKGYKFLACAEHGNVCSCGVYKESNVLMYSYVLNGECGTDVVPIKEVKIDKDVDGILVETCGSGIFITVKNEKCINRNTNRIKVVN